MMSDSLIFSESRFSFLDENAVTGWSAWGLRTTRNGKSWGLQTLRRASAANQSARYENLATKFSQCLRNPCEPADRCASIRAMNAPSSQSPSPDRRPIRRYRRLVGWDYSKGASFFITISTEPRRSLFGRVENRDMVLSPLGERVFESLEAIPAYNPGIALYGHVVMPDHVHLRCHLASGLAGPLQTIGHAIRRFKNHTTKVYRELSASAEPSSALFTPGEHRLFDALAAAGMPMVKLQTRAIGWGYRPVGLEPELFARKQLLIIAAMGSPSTPSSRFELLELNRQAARIALASPGGMAVHAVPQSGGVAYLPGEV